MNTTSNDPRDIARDLAAVRNAGPSLAADDIARAARVTAALGLDGAPAERIAAALYGTAATQGEGGAK